VVFRIWGRAIGRKKSYDVDVLTLGLTCERGLLQKRTVPPNNPSPKPWIWCTALLGTFGMQLGSTSCSWLAYLTYAGVVEHRGVLLERGVQVRTVIARSPSPSPSQLGAQMRPAATTTTAGTILRRPFLSASCTIIAKSLYLSTV
jgi:hypothetical protein